MPVPRPSTSERLDRRAPRGRRARTPLSCLVLLALVLSACQRGPGSPPGAGPGGAVLRVGTPFLGEPDPVRGGFTAVQLGLAETLVRLDPALQPQPWLAASLRPRSPTTWAVTLRPGVTFHNGAPMDAPAVKASLERSVALSPSARTLLGLTAVAVTGPLSLLLTTAGPTPQLPGLLSDPSTAIVDAAAATAQGSTSTARPVTTSAFRVERYEADHELVALRHDGHWAGPAATRRLEVSVLPDAGARVLALQSGQLDVALDVQPDSVRQLEGDGELRAVVAPPVATVFAYLDHSRAPFDDLRVRQALAHAVPAREAVVRAVLRGQGLPAAGIFPPAVLDCGTQQPYPYDPGTARRLLAEAGYRDGDEDGVLERDGRPLEVVLLSYPQRPALTPAAEVLQSSLAAVGIDVRVRVVEQIDDALGRDDWNASMYFNNLAATGDPYGSLSRFFRTGGDANAGRYSNRSTDASVDRLRTLTGRQQRRDLSCDTERALVRDVAVLPLAHPDQVYGVRKGVTGFATAHPYFLYFIDREIGTG